VMICYNNNLLCNLLVNFNISFKNKKLIVFLNRIKLYLWGGILDWLRCLMMLLHWIRYLKKLDPWRLLWMVFFKGIGRIILLKLSKTLWEVLLGIHWLHTFYKLKIDIMGILFCIGMGLSYILILGTFWPMRLGRVWSLRKTVLSSCWPHMCRF
jgi:hypothetical protein